MGDQASAWRVQLTAVNMNKKPMLTELEQRAIYALPADLRGALVVVRELHAEQGSFSEHFRYLVLSQFGPDATAELEAIQPAKPNDLR